MRSIETVRAFGRLSCSHSITEFVLKSIVFQDNLFKDSGKARGAKMKADMSRDKSLVRAVRKKMRAKTPSDNNKKVIIGKADISLLAI